MKKLFTVVILLYLRTFVCAAAKDNEKTTVALLENGSYCVTVKGRDTQYIFPAEENLSTDVEPEGINKKITELTTEDLFNGNRLAEMKKHSVNVSLDKAEKTAGNLLYLTMTFTNREKWTHTRQIAADMVYGEGVYSQDGRYTDGKLTVYWGDVSFDRGENKDTDRDDLFIISHDDKTDMLYATDYSPTGISFDYSFTGARKVFVIDTVRTDQGYISAYTGINTQGFALFDKAGRLVWDNKLKVWDNLHHHILGCMDTRCSRQDNTYNPYAINTDYYLQTADRYIIVKQEVSVWSGMAYIYDTGADILYSVTDCRYDSERENKFYLMSLAGATQNYIMPQDSKSYFALLQTDSESKAMLLHSEKLGLMGSGTVEISGDGNKIDFSLEKINRDICVDFENRHIAVDYKEFSTEKANAVTENENYTIYTTGDYDGKGIYNSLYFLQEKSTGKTKYLATLKGEYLPETTTGFLANGDVFMLDGDGYRLFSADMEQEDCYFKLNCPSVGNLQIRELLAVAPDKYSQNYIAVYYEQPYYRNSSDNFMYRDPNKLKGTYILGIFDSRGNLVKRYDTGINVEYGPAGASNITINRTGENTVEFSSWTVDPDRHGDIVTVNTSNGAVKVTDVIAADREGNFMLVPGKDKLFYGRTIALYNKKTGEETTFATTTFPETEKDIAGFMANGSVYLRGLNEYEVMDVYSNFRWRLGNDEFDFGSRYLDGVTLFTRWIENVSHDYGGNPSAALYYEFYDDDRGYKTNQYQLNYTYKVAVFGEKGNLKETYETNLNVFPDAAVTVYGENNGQVQLKVEQNGRTLSLGYIDLETGLYNAIAGYLR